MLNRRQITWLSVLVPIVLLLAMIAAWAIDTGASRAQVLRNVTLAGNNVGGLGADELLKKIEELDAQLADREIRIDSGGVTYETSAREIGLSVDTVGTANATLDEGRTAPMVIRPFGWLLSFVVKHDARVHFTVDSEQARSAILMLEGSARVSPVEPTLVSRNGGEFEVVAGKPGTGIDPDHLSAELLEAARDSDIDEPLLVAVTPTDVLPRLTEGDAVLAAAIANEVTSRVMRVEAAGRTLTLVPRTLRSLAVPVEGEDTITVSLDAEATRELLNDEFGDLTAEAQDASFTIEDGKPVIIPSTNGLFCCDDDHVEAIEAAMLTGETDVELDLREVVPGFTTEDAEALEIIEEVGSPSAFGPTTQFPCCQPRVENIHRIADLVRGVVIEPGETFSVNGHVGERTLEKGFVADGVIYDGVMTQDVGGGVSQFATTLFNAALYAGLDFGTYQSHSLYISRYPRGHEATISFPAPDLEIVNNTAYGVLLWPEYTNTSITVRVYSTDHIDVTVGSPTSSPSGNCTRWTTPRTRTYPDGTTESDTVSARYRPREGVSC